MKIDLHSHTTYSDGTLDAEDLVRSAHEQNITHLAITDHDSTGSLKTAREKAKEYNMTIIPGVEINTKEDVSIHVLGYFVDEDNQEFQDTLNRHRQIRVDRAQKILDKLHRMGIKISLSDFNHRNQSAAIGRPHIADKLKEKGIVFSRQEAFDKFLANGRPAHIQYEGPSPKDAIDAILKSNGVPVLAHPGFYVSPETIENLKGIGLQGIEVYYPSHRPDQVRNFVNLAKKLDLVITGGSDYHGPGSGHERLGEMDVPLDTIDKILERKSKLKV